MAIEFEIIAKKYARAFLNANHTTISNKTIEQCAKLAQFLTTHKNILPWLSLTLVPPEKKIAFLERVIAALSLDTSIKILIGTLYKHKRVLYLCAVVKNIIKEYQKRRGIVIFAVSTSHPLQDDEKQRIIDFIQHEVPGKTVQTEFAVNPALISGIRIKSDSLLWERSISKLLHHVKQSLFARVEL